MWICTTSLEKTRNRNLGILVILHMEQLRYLLGQWKKLETRWFLRPKNWHRELSCAISLVGTSVVSHWPVASNIKVRGSELHPTEAPRVIRFAGPKLEVIPGAWLISTGDSDSILLHVTDQHAWTSYPYSLAVAKWFRDVGPFIVHPFRKGNMISTEELIPLGWVWTTRHRQNTGACGRHVGWQAADVDVLPATRQRNTGGTWFGGPKQP